MLSLDLIYIVTAIFLKAIIQKPELSVYLFGPFWFQDFFNHIMSDCVSFFQVH